eukprot:9152943-Heterocapsa_arctica.AAC.1
MATMYIDKELLEETFAWINTLTSSSPESAISATHATRATGSAKETGRGSISLTVSSDHRYEYWTVKYASLSQLKRERASFWNKEAAEFKLAHEEEKGD